MRNGAMTRGRHRAQTDHRWLPLIVALAMAMAMVATAPAEPAEATHFRAAQLNWTAVGATTAQFESTIGVRRSFYGTPNVGDTIVPISIGYGDGAFENPPHTVVAVDVANDWLLAEANFQHVYLASGPYVASMFSCCRLSGPLHVNNPDGNLNVETVVDFATTTANPVSAIAPIVDCPIDALCQFSVPGFDPDGQAMSFRLATDVEASGFAGGFTQPTGATIDASTGLYSWNTTGVTTNPSGDTFYSTQVMIDNVVGGIAVSKTAVDFFIRLGTGSANQQPQFVAPTPADGTVINTTVGATVSFGVAATDPDTGDTVTLSMLGKPADATYSTVSGNPATGSFSWVPAGTQTVILTLQAQDQLGLGATPRSITINVTAPPGNQPPVVDAGTNASGVEGSPIALAGSASDPDADTLTIGWSYTAGGNVDAGATCAFSAPSAVATDITCTDDGTYTVTLSADDGTAPPVTDTATVTVANVAPAITSITGPTHPVAVSVVVGVSAPFTDPGANDTHVCTIDWGDGTTSTVVDPATTPCDGNHSYLAAGIHTVTVTVTDDDGGSDTEIFQYVVVYDPAAGFVTGGGWIDSPAGAYTADPTLTGKASFGFVSKYKKGANIPDGQTQFQFQAGGLNFHSTMYEWLVVAGPKGQYKGSGTINGAGDYGFMLTVNDGQQPGGGDVDRFRIKIWDKGTDTIIYDNQVGEADDAGASTVLGGGSIVIHTSKK